MRMILQVYHKFGEYSHVSIWYLKKEQSFTGPLIGNICYQSLVGRFLHICALSSKIDPSLECQMMEVQILSNPKNVLM
jgi:hypothetical protein